MVIKSQADGFPKSELLNFWWPFQMQQTGPILMPPVAPVGEVEPSLHEVGL